MQHIPVDPDDISQNYLIPDQRRWLEITAVVITGLGKFLFMDWLDWRFAYIFSACLFWLIYVVVRYRENPHILTYWGFTFSNFKETFLLLLPFGVVSVVTFLITGELLGTNILSWHILPLLVLYPIWGTIQQFLMVGLVAGNLREMERVKLSHPLIIVLNAILFAIVHFPHVTLAGGTFFLALAYTFVYLRKKNLFVLGLYHGWIGAFFFYTILERDSFMEVFGKLIE
ncbi:MAG: CPBP family glutamic-type intramembrane protease [Bacteroidota bacterium]